MLPSRPPGAAPGTAAEKPPHSAGAHIAPRVQSRGGWGDHCLCQQSASARGYTSEPGCLEIQPVGLTHPRRGPPSKCDTHPKPAWFVHSSEHAFFQKKKKNIAFSRNFSFWRTGWLGSYSPVGTHIGGFSHVEPTPAFQRETPLDNNVLYLLYFLYNTRFDARIFLIQIFCFFSWGHRSVP